VIIRTDQELRRTRYGPDAVSYRWFPFLFTIMGNADFPWGAEFAQVGNDAKATRFLEELDNHPQIGGLIDATSPYEVEQAEMARKSVSVELSFELSLY
jgi:hypothetical protein